MTNNQDTERWPPKRLDVPDLSHLSEKMVLNQMLNIFFRKTGPRDPLHRALFTNYVRLTDQIIREYKNASEALNEYVSSPSGVISPMFRSIGHFENCLRDLKRAIEFGRAARNIVQRKISGDSVLSDNVFYRINNIHKAIEHIDEKYATAK